VSARLVFACSLGLALVAGCSVDASRNPTPRCASDSDCVGGNHCYRGLCVGGSGTDGGSDANLPPIDANFDAGPNHDAFVPDAFSPDTNVDADLMRTCTTSTDCGDDGDACNGTEVCMPDGHCDFGTPQDDGVVCERDGMPSTRDLCIDHACAQTRCGDGFFDVMNMEVCDDGNTLLGDGCDDCRYSCTMDSACVDTNECNGDETCSPTAHACTSGDAPDEGSACRGGRGTCTAGECVPNSCTTGADCDDLDECNGVESCNTTTHLCVPGPAMDCGDGNTCTADACTRGLGCSHVLMDADGDTFAPVSCAGPTGDCDDADPGTYPGAPEICGDTIDNNCSGDTLDESDSWYADCDSDGYAAAGAQIGHSCSGPPSMAPAICVAGGWTARQPTTVTTTQDCNDGNAAVNPGQTAYQTTAIVGAPAATNYDYNCDGAETPRSTTVGVCSGSLGLCSLSQGWVGGVPACGAEVQWILSCAGLGCTRGSEPRIQACL
jgi:cysteine-rich repeat protein